MPRKRFTTVDDGGNAMIAVVGDDGGHKRLDMKKAVRYAKHYLRKDTDKREKRAQHIGGHSAGGRIGGAPSRNGVW